MRNTTITPPTPPIINFLIHAFLFIFYYNVLESFYNCIDKLFNLSDFLSAVSRSLILLTILFTFPFIIVYNSITLELRASIFVLALIILICQAIFILILSSDMFEDSYSIPFEIIAFAVCTEGPSRRTTWFDFAEYYLPYFFKTV